LRKSRFFVRTERGDATYQDVTASVS
jgi:hypothetical protein